MSETGWIVIIKRDSEPVESYPFEDGEGSEARALFDKLSPGWTECYLCRVVAPIREDRPPVGSVGVDRVGEIMAYATGALCGLDGTGKGDEGVIEIMLEAERRIAALADSTGEG